MPKRPPARVPSTAVGREGALDSNQQVWVMLGFDSRTFELFVPTPGVFTSEGDAAEFSRRFSKDGILYASRKTVVGSFGKKKRRR